MKKYIKWGFLFAFFLFLFFVPKIGIIFAVLSFFSISAFVYLHSEEARLKEINKKEIQTEPKKESQKKDKIVQQVVETNMENKEKFSDEIVFKKNVNIHAFFEAAKNNDIETINLFLKDRVNIDLENEKGVTALMIATKFKSYEVAKKLIENNANPNKRTKKGTTAMQIAQQNNDEQMIEILN